MSGEGSNDAPPYICYVYIRSPLHGGDRWLFQDMMEDWLLLPGGRGHFNYHGLQWAVAMVVGCGRGMGRPVMGQAKIMGHGHGIG